LTFVNFVLFVSFVLSLALSYQHGVPALHRRDTPVVAQDVERRVSPWRMR